MVSEQLALIIYQFGTSLTFGLWMHSWWAGFWMHFMINVWAESVIYLKRK